MDEYRYLLESIGIFDHNIPVDEKPPSPPPSEPSSDDGEYAFWDVRDNLNSEYMLDYSQEIEYSLNCKKLHRYSRKDRFRFILYQLLGISGDIPKSVVTIVRRGLGKKTNTSTIWNQVRLLLKQNKLRKYYNRIPQLIRHVVHKSPTGITYSRVASILEDFSNFDYQFDNNLRFKWDRRYFPNLRFVALKLIAKYEISFPYHVTLVRTSRKKKYLEKLYEQFE